MAFYRWVLVVIIAVTVAFVTRFVQVSKDLLLNLRNDVVQRDFDAGGDFWDSFPFFAAWNLGCVFIAAVVTAFFEPASAADGIAEIKAYLNGTHVTVRRPARPAPLTDTAGGWLLRWCRREHCAQAAGGGGLRAAGRAGQGFLSLRTIVCKIFTTILASAASLASGVEAPLIHIGAGIASGVTRGDKMRNACVDFAPKLLGRFHNDRDRRAFISAGAGAGMAAAFGAPIGGVLFVLEETASHWSPALVWRIFTASLITTMVLSLIKVPRLPVMPAALQTSSLLLTVSDRVYGTHLSLFALSLSSFFSLSLLFPLSLPLSLSLNHFALSLRPGRGAPRRHLALRPPLPRHAAVHRPRPHRRRAQLHRRHRRHLLVLPAPCRIAVARWSLVHPSTVH